MNNTTAIKPPILGLATTLTLPIFADDADTKLGLSGEVAMEFEVVSIPDSDDPDDELTEAGLTIEPALNYTFTPHWSVQASLVLESVLETEPGEDRFVEDTSLYMEQLFLQYRDSWGQVHAGKFTPPSAWPGMRLPVCTAPTSPKTMN